MSKKQAQRLDVQPHSRWSPDLEKCCLRLSANEFYKRSAEDIQGLTGIVVSHRTRPRLVHRQNFELPKVEQVVEELSVDGGKVRLCTSKGRPSEWKDDKGVNLHECGVGAFFQDNPSLVNWVNEPPWSNPLTCLGDGHDGIWNIFQEIDEESQRREILDWYHLVENLGKVGGSQQRLDGVESSLWRGQVDEAIELFNDWCNERVSNFITYLNQHRHRIVNYDYYQSEGISIGSGAIESTIKQIGRRIKISRAQWEKDNVSQVLKQRSAYLNGEFSK